MKRLMRLVVAAALVFGAGISMASAGGWAVVTLDALPTNVVVNQPVTVAMMIRQHGQTPWVYKYVEVRGFHATGETIGVRAVMDTPGHYTAVLNFPKAGKWEWEVASGLMPEWQHMPTLEVANSAEDEVLLAKANEANRAAMPSLETMMPSMLLLGLGVLGFVGSGAGLVWWWRKKG